MNLTLQQSSFSAGWERVLGSLLPLATVKRERPVIVLVVISDHICDPLFWAIIALGAAKAWTEISCLGLSASF